MSNTTASKPVRVVSESDAYEALLPGRENCREELEGLVKRQLEIIGEDPDRHGHSPLPPRPPGRGEGAVRAKPRGASRDGARDHALLLEKDARAKGFGLIATKAAALQSPRR